MRRVGCGWCLCLVASVPAAAYELRTDSDGDVVAWRQQVVLTRAPDFFDAWGVAGAEVALQRALQAMQAATPALSLSLRVAATTGVGFDVDRPEANQSELLLSRDWPYDDDDALAATILTIDRRTNRIIDADIVINLEHHRFGVLAGPQQPQALEDIQNMLMHEFGHALGLLHSRAHVDLVMYPIAAPGEVVKRTLRADDLAGLAALYGFAAASVPMPENQQPPGCAVAFSPLAILLLVWRRSWRGLAVVACLVAQAAFAQTQAEVVVEQAVARRAGAHIVTTLHLSTQHCFEGRCPQTMTVTVPGGRWGELEQVVVHHPVPAVGERLWLVLRSDGRVRLRAVRESKPTDAVVSP